MLALRSAGRPLVFQASVKPSATIHQSELKRTVHTSAVHVIRLEGRADPAEQRTYHPSPNKRVALCGDIQEAALLAAEEQRRVLHL